MQRNPSDEKRGGCNGRMARGYDMMKPIVALVGRPNVGKSTLFNRLTRTRNALVDDRPGVTRDRHFGEAVWNDIPFTVVDTGGFLAEDTDPFAPLIRTQVIQAVSEADVVVLILDGKYGVSPYDGDMLRLLRSQARRLAVVVNKIDGPMKEIHLNEFYELGFEPLFSLSAEHAYGIEDFLDHLVGLFPEIDSDTEPIQEDEQISTIRLAIVGRPNVGKSSLINRIIGENRLLVSDVPGTTRDAIDISFRKGKNEYVLIDTAGIRRKAKVDEKIEKLSIIKSLQSLEHCDIALIVLDAAAGVTEQDVHIAGYAAERNCGCIFLWNKWDLVDKQVKTVRTMTEMLRDTAKFLQFAPVLTVSAQTGQRVSGIFPLVDTVFRQYGCRLTTAAVNRMLEKALARKEPSIFRGKRLKFYYMTQVATRPPSFVAFVNHPEGIHFSYERYLINQIRQEFGLDVTPIRLMFRERSGRKLPSRAK